MKLKTSKEIDNPGTPENKKRDFDDLSSFEEIIRYHANILQHVSDAVIATNIDSEITSWNRAAERIYGWSAEEVIGKKYRRIIETGYRYSSREEFYKTIESSDNWYGTLVHHRKDGSEIVVSCNISKLYDQHGNQIGMVSINHDITELKKTEIEREKLIAELQDTISQMKTLRGLVPICAACKKIRDDHGFWNDVEIYVAQHSDAEFSHGLCPDCMRKLYPEYAERIEEKQRKERENS